MDEVIIRINARECSITAEIRGMKYQRIMKKSHFGIQVVRTKFLDISDIITCRPDKEELSDGLQVIDSAAYSVMRGLEENENE